jgi:CBS domain containing-hemolysin-like protein
LGDVIEHNRYRFHIESVTRRRIKRIKFVILDTHHEDEEEVLA